MRNKRYLSFLILIKKHIFNSKTNNEIKVLKNNKLVYINKDLLKSYSTSRAIKKLKKINFIIRKKRSSKYRGVSKNGNKWQVLIMINKNKHYLGNYPSEDLAARIYDIQAIKNWGIKARTNFVYDNNQIKKIYNKNINIKCNDISDIMAQINN
jgi:predicted transcriptional regulator